MTEAHDIWEPKLRVRASGYGGSGYILPHLTGGDGQQLKVPGVTTILGALPKEGLIQWSVDNTVAYMLANLDRVMDLEDSVAFQKFRFYHSRKPAMDSPELNPFNAHAGVLNDAAETGTRVHDWIAAHVTGLIEPELVNAQQEEAVEAFLKWYADQDISPVLTEATVVNETLGYAGTLDHVWNINGRTLLVDVKTSKRVYDSHVAQIAALRNSEYRMVETTKGKGVLFKSRRHGDTYWTAAPLPEVEGSMILKTRFEDIDNQGTVIDPVCEPYYIKPEFERVGFNLFTACLTMKKALSTYAKTERALGDPYYG